MRRHFHDDITVVIVFLDSNLIEQNKARLVITAHDVDPIESVVWLPTLCWKMEIPYCIVKGKARLGAGLFLPYV